MDILNCMGFAIAVLSVMALFRTAERVRLVRHPGPCNRLRGAADFADGLVGAAWRSCAHYLVPDYRFFGFFPWGAYLAFGMSAGSIIRMVPQEAIDRAMQWARAGRRRADPGLPVFLRACRFRFYAKSEYWLNSPAQILTKLGVVLLLLAFAFLWTRYGAKDGWSWVRQFGTTSLLVYWVHIELVYGRWLWFFKNNLNVGQTVAAAVAIILAMLAISTAKTHRERLQVWLAETGWSLRGDRSRLGGSRSESYVMLRFASAGVPTRPA